jgi:hypothetical protein
MGLRCCRSLVLRPDVLNAESIKKDSTRKSWVAHGNKRNKNKKTNSVAFSPQANYTD